MPLEGLPESTLQNGHEDYVVQDLNIEAHNVCYRRLRYLLPDGTHQTTPLPAHVQGHFGAGIRSYVLYQYHQNCVTQRKGTRSFSSDHAWERQLVAWKIRGGEDKHEMLARLCADDPTIPAGRIERARAEVLADHSVAALLNGA